jgi:hypothetical protein
VAIVWRPLDSSWHAQHCFFLGQFTRTELGKEEGDWSGFLSFNILFQTSAFMVSRRPLSPPLTFSLPPSFPSRLLGHVRSVETPPPASGTIPLANGTAASRGSRNKNVPPGSRPPIRSHKWKTVEEDEQATACNRRMLQPAAWPFSFQDSRSR